MIRTELHEILFVWYCWIRAEISQKTDVKTSQETENFRRGRKKIETWWKKREEIRGRQEKRAVSLKRQRKTKEA